MPQLPTWRKWVDFQAPQQTAKRVLETYKQKLTRGDLLIKLGEYINETFEVGLTLTKPEILAVIDFLVFLEATDL